MTRRIFDNGDEAWVNEEGVLHRDDDLPAVIWTNGDQFWYQNGELHRKDITGEDLPAYIGVNGDQEWYQNGDLHRENDQPALIWANGDHEWYQNGFLIRLLGYSNTHPYQWSIEKHQTDQIKFLKNGNQIKLLRKGLIKK